MPINALIKVDIQSTTQKPLNFPTVFIYKNAHEVKVKEVKYEVLCAVSSHQQ